MREAQLWEARPTLLRVPDLSSLSSPETQILVRLTSTEQEVPAVAVCALGGAGQLCCRPAALGRQADWTPHRPQGWGGDREREAGLRRL